MKTRLIDMIIPGMLIAGSFYLVANGIDGEVKAILTLAAGWAFHAGIKKNK